MTDPFSDPGVSVDSSPDSEPESTSDAAPRTPRWVVILGVITLVALLLAVVAVATGVWGPGDHGPGRHLPSSGAGRLASDSGATMNSTLFVECSAGPTGDTADLGAAVDLTRSAIRLATRTGLATLATSEQWNA